MAWVVKSADGRTAGGGCVWLQQVQPRPHHASMVVKEATKWCRKKGYERLMLHASEMGRRVYSKLGFKRTWEMRLDLTSK